MLAQTCGLKPNRCDLSANNAQFNMGRWVRRFHHAGAAMVVAAGRGGRLSQIEDKFSCGGQSGVGTIRYLEA